MSMGKYVGVFFNGLVVLVRYFMWDALDAIINYIDPGFVAHGIACFSIFFMTFVSVFFFCGFPTIPLSLLRNSHSFLRYDSFQRPFMAYYGTRVLLWETSTFFLNNHW